MFVHKKEDLFDGMINSIYIKREKKSLFNNVIILNKIQIRFADSNDLLLFENIYFTKWWILLFIPDIHASHLIYFTALLSSRNLIEVICSNMNSACVSKNTFQNIIAYQ